VRVPDDIPAWFEKLLEQKLEEALTELVKTSSLGSVGKIAALRELAQELELRAVEQSTEMKERAEALLGRSNN